jgi:uncharacterized RDD family membrane protein YckC
MSTATLAPRDDPLDTTIRLITPERIQFEYPLAGPFRRSLAYLLDFLILAICCVVLFLASVILSLGSAAGLGVFFAVFFGVWWGYGAFFEGVFNGQTPGKMALGIRVVSAQGVPITGAQAVLRNFLWTIDGVALGFIPAILCMLISGKFQRLGDLAAGTIVMVEQSPRRGRVQRVDEPAVQAVLPWLPKHIDAGPELARALADYVRSRTRFNRPRREEMAAHLARPVRRLYGVPAEVPGDAVVCALYHRVFLGD